jgi:nucleotide-binding universal stress UspA family protein
VKDQERGFAPGDQQEMIKNILFPVDFSPSCAAMATYVQRAAAIFGAKVTIVHICDLSSHNGFELYARPAGEIAEEHRSLAKSKLELFLRSEFPIAQYPRILLAGDAASLITETAKKNECDLIMMPTHAGRFRRMMLGSTTAKVLDDADCPVLTSQHTETIAPRSLEHRE